MLLTVFGGFVVVLMHLASLLITNDLGFLIASHSFIILIGVLTGFELPLLIEMAGRYEDKKEGVVLGISYLGAFTGSVIFAFLLYPKVGLVPTAFLVGLLNSLAGLLTFSQRRLVAQHEKPKPYLILISLQLVIFLIVGAMLTKSSAVREYLIAKYLS
jgi:spermidine synthase